MFEMDVKRKKAKKWLCIAVALMLVSMIGASLIQTSGGSVTVKDLQWETSLGVKMSGLLFVPKNATAESPAPAIVLSHGMFNNKEMQDLNYVELARRGYVVLAIDMFSHGNSENVSDMGQIMSSPYEAVKMLATVNYVDSTRIGLTGHSFGSISSSYAAVADNFAEKQLIAAVLSNSGNALYNDGQQYSNVYGSRDVGIIASRYDEFQFTQDDGKGGTTAPRDFINTSNAQSFLHFGQDPSGLESRTAETMYYEEIDGKEALRIIYTPDQTHAWAHFSARSTAATIEFFETALGAPNPLPAGSQIWQWKEFFNLLGLIGLAMFIVSFAIFMVFTPAFASLRGNELAKPFVITSNKGKSWFWGTLLAIAVFSAIIYPPLMQWLQDNSAIFPLPQPDSAFRIGVWATICGLFTLVCLFASYKAYGQKEGLSLADRGASISVKKLGRTILLALIVVAVTYSWVFIADYFFKVDFRIWLLAVKPFGSDKLLLSLFPYALLYIIYFVCNSIAVNSFNYNEIGKKEWLNTAIMAAANALPIIVLILIQYIYQRSTGHILFNNITIVWTFPILVILPATAIISRKIYKVTNNPFLPGIINGIVVTLIACANTLTYS